MEAKKANLYFHWIQKLDLRRITRSLKKGLNPNLVKDKNGSTGIVVAIVNFSNEEDAIKIVSVLLQYRANPNIQNKHGKTGLHYAAEKEYVEVADLLVRNGADPLRSDLRGLSPIDVAHTNRCFSIAAFLRKLLDSEPAITAFDSNDQYLFFKYKCEVVFCQDSPDHDDSILAFGDFGRKDTSQILCKFICSENCTRNGDISSSTKKSCRCKLPRRNGPAYNSEDAFVISISENFSTSQEYITCSSTINDNCNNMYIKSGKYDQMITNDSTLVENGNKRKFDTAIVGPRYICQFFSHSISDLSDIVPYRMESSALKQLSLSSCKTDHASSNETYSKRYLSSNYATIMEEFLYEDIEKGIKLVERRCPNEDGVIGSSESFFSTHSGCEKENNTLKLSSLSDDHAESISSSIKKLSSSKLRVKLATLGFEPGPVTPTTLQVLQRHCTKLLRCPDVDSVKPAATKRKCHTHELRFALRDPSMIHSFDTFVNQMVEPFQEPDSLSYWREGSLKKCFNYILLDPNITKNLPLRSQFLTDSEKFRIFLSSIFYVGKGTKARPYAHLYDAIKDKTKIGKVKQNVTSKKIEYIRSIWDMGNGVVCLNCFHHVIPVEAYTREAAMIDAIGLVNLCNESKGIFYGPSTTWVRSKRRLCGISMVWRALKILLAEGERQIRPHDLCTV